MSGDFGAKRLHADLCARGYEAVERSGPNGETFVVVPAYSIELGRFSGRVIGLGLQATADFPRTPPSAIHVQANPHIYEFGSVPNVRNIQASVLGEGWQYWSHNFGWTTERTTRTLLSQISRIFHDA